MPKFVIKNQLIYFSYTTVLLMISFPNQLPFTIEFFIEILNITVSFCEINFKNI